MADDDLPLFRPHDRKGRIRSGVGPGGRRVTFSAPPHEVRGPSVAAMLVLKVARFAGDTDIADAKLLLGKLGTFSGVEQVWNWVGGLVPVAHGSQARHNPEILWEVVHEPP
jgi:hypothetical protein